MSSTNGSTEKSPMAKKRRAMSRRFCASEADLTVLSSDGIVFKVFSKDLSAFSEAFPCAEFTKLDTREVVSLPENYSVLELLFQFTRRQRQPNLDDVPFSTLAALAEAVEKYGVFTATEVCRGRMRAAMTEHPVQVLAYASRHGISDLSDLAARLTLGESATTMKMELTDKALLAWFMYREAWVQCLADLANKIKEKTGAKPCPTWEQFEQWVDSDVNRQLIKLQRSTFDVEGCPAIDCRECEEMRGVWKAYTGSILISSSRFSKYL